MVQASQAVDDSAARAGPARTAQLDKLFESVNRNDGPGLVVGVARHGQVLYRRGFGLASVQHGVANLASTRVRIASISKHFTALAALLLVEDGKLNIDAPVDRYLLGMPKLDGFATLRQFMNHTSGYRCTLDLGTLANGEAMQPSGWQLKAMLRQTGANFPPGEGQMYCNGTYAAMSTVIEQVGGVSFAEFMKTRIFDPLGMRDTKIVSSDLHMVPGMASAHIPALGGGWQRPPTDAELLGDGSMVSSVDDMLRWMAHLNGVKRVGTPETWRQMLEPAVLASGLVSTYALGLRRSAYREVETLHHSGGLFGLSAYMLTFPTKGLDIFMAVNGAPVNASELCHQVADLVLGDELPGPSPASVATSDFRHLVGARYQGRTGLLLQFVDVGGSLGLSLMNMARAPTLLDKGDTLYVGFESFGQGPYVWKKSDLTADAAGDPPALLAMAIYGYPEIFERLPAVAPEVSLVGGALVGRYWSHDLAAEAEIAFDDKLFMRIKGDYSAARTFELEPFSSIAFGVGDVDNPSDRYALTIDRPGGKAPAFWIDTFRARRMRFERIADAN